MYSEDSSTLMSVPVALSHTGMRRPEAAVFHIECLACSHIPLGGDMEQTMCTSGRTCKHVFARCRCAQPGASVAGVNSSIFCFSGCSSV